MTRFGITLVVLYSFTNLQLLQALENGDGSASSAPPPRSSCFPTIGGFLMGAIIGGGAVYYHCAARHKPPTTLSSTASSAVLSTTEQQSTAIQLVLFSVFFTPIMLFGCYILYLLIEERLASAEEKKAKVKPAVGPKSNIDDPKMMSTTNEHQVNKCHVKMVPRQFWIALAALYSFTNWQLLLALEDGAGSSSEAPPPRSTTENQFLISLAWFFTYVIFAIWSGLLLFLITKSYICPSSTEKEKPNAGTNSDVNDPKMMSTTTSQVQSSTSSTAKDIA